MPARIDSIKDAKRRGIVERDAVEDAIDAYKMVAEDGFSRVMQAIEKMSLSIQKSESVDVSDISRELSVLTKSIVGALMMLKPEKEEKEEKKRAVFTNIERDSNGRITSFEMIEK